MQKRTFNDFRKDYNLTLIRSSRRSIAVEIRPSGIIVRAPKSMKNSEIEAFLQKKESWIEKHYEKMQKRLAEAPDVIPFSVEEIQGLADQALKTIPRRVAYYAPLIGVDYGRITIRCQRTRWGSCSSKGNLNFNCLLMLMPEEVLDSVVVHELCHRKHMNHSRQFYEEIEKVFPDYQRCHKWLKENGSLYLRRLPG